MKRREYLFGFVLVLVGLSIGFAISAPPTSTPWHPLQLVLNSDQSDAVSVDLTGTTGVGTGNPNKIIDKADFATKSGGFDVAHCAGAIRETYWVSDYNFAICAAGNVACMAQDCVNRGYAGVGYWLYWINGNGFQIYDCWRNTVPCVI